jgi:F-type H+-transporting ATPase subunit delta
MNYSLVTVRYAKALYQLAEEEKIQDAVRIDMDTFLSCINESEEFLFLLESPLIKSKEKVRIMDEIFEGKLQGLTIKFIHLLFNQRREGHLADICRNFAQYYKQKLGIKEAVITTAQPLPSDQKAQIINYINNIFKLKTELTEKQDSSIIGGFVLRVEDQQIDASISAQLKKIKRELINS